MYHATLGGQGLVLDLQAYRKRTARQFADKVADGDLDTGDLLVEQVWRQADWSGGEPALREESPSASGGPGRPGRYRAGPGVDGFAEAGSLRLGPGQVTAYASTNNGFTVAATYQGEIFAGTTDGKLYRSSGGAWSLWQTWGKAGGVRAMAVYKGILYVGNGSDGAVASWDGTTWNAAKFTVAGSSGVRALAVYYDGADKDGRLWVGSSGSGTNGVAEVYYWDSVTLSAYQHRCQEPRVEAMAVLDGALYIFGGDTQTDRGGIYKLRGTSWSIVAPVPEGRPTAALLWRDRIYVGIGTGLWVFDGNELELVRAGLTEASELGGLAVWRGALHVSASSASGGSAGPRVWRYSGADEAGWSEIAGSASGGTAAAGLVVSGGDLYQLGQQAGAAPIVRYPASGTYRASGTLETSIFDGGLPLIDKVFRTAAVRHAALAAGESVQVQYRLEDAGVWTALGTSATIGATGASFACPAATVGKLIALRLVLAGPGASTPVVYDVTTSYQLAPTLKREWELVALCDGTAELPLVTLDQTASPQTGAQVLAQLWALRGQSGPHTLVDLDGVSYSVWFVDLVEETAERSQRRGRSARAKCRLVEAG